MTANTFISVVIPMRNEENYIEKCLESFINQDYHKDFYEVLVVDGMSSDNSRHIVQSLANKQSYIFLIDNPNIFTSFAFNLGIMKSKGEIIVILGSHSFVAPDFLRKIVDIFNKVDADCIGGRIETIGETNLSKAISMAMSSPFGVGDALFRYSKKEGYVDTVAFGAYKREIFKKVGLFDEELVRNQDDEFNYRLRKHGGKIFLSPEIRSFYYSRASLKKLWKQYFDYGYWKVRVFQKHPKMMKLRHFIPGVFLVSILATSALSLYSPVYFSLFLLIIVCYGVCSLFFSLKVASQKGYKYVPLLNLSFITLHVSYGIGFLVGIVSFFKRWFVSREPDTLKLK